MRLSPVPPSRSWFVVGLVIPAILPLLIGPTGVAAQVPCDPPLVNPIACENSKPGDPASQWDITGSGDPSIQGFATAFSVNKGELLHIKIDTDASAYWIDIYRLGYYGGLGARKVATIQPWVPLPQVQPPCLTELLSGLVDCGNWEESAVWSVPDDATSGVYIGKLVRFDTGGASHLVFVVRDDSSAADLLFQTSDTTWQAYNDYGGHSLYSGSPGVSPGRAYKVSYNRPFNTRGNIYGRSWLFSAEYPMIRWLEANGYHVSYFTGVDTARRGEELLEHQAFLSVGHDEYWSAEQRANVEAARNAGVHLGFFSGNEMFWKARWEPSIDGSGTPYRTLVSYKETHADAKIDPFPNSWTGTWRDPRFSPPADGNRPENALTGTIFSVNCCRQDPITIPEPLGKLRFWRNTSVATLPPGQTATLPPGVLGYEWDEDRDNGTRPDGSIQLSSTTVNVPFYLLDYGNTYGPGTATHNLTLYRHESGALVFGAGTIRWSWGLDATHDSDPATSGATTEPDGRMQQATVNLLGDMGVQPATLRPGLVPAAQSADTISPTSVVSSPAAGATVSVGLPVLIAGTATDAGGGQVAAVEVSVDGGSTWHRASGFPDWTYTWIPETPGPAIIGSSAVDDSGNIEIPSTGVTVTVETPPAATCPCTIWSADMSPAVAADIDANPIELGLKFRSDADGYITALRFYKGPGNTGPHIGHLWTTAGTLLSTVTFSPTTALGWQQASFPSPVPIPKNTTYIASYYAPAGHYSADSGYFAVVGVYRPPLRALASTASGGNGVFRYGPTGFPDQSYQSNHYWLDVVFDGVAPTDTVPPVVTSVSPPNGTESVNLGVRVTATFTEAMAPTTLNVNTFQIRDSSNSLVPATVTYDDTVLVATLTPTLPLTSGITYSVTLRGGSVDPRVTDAAGNPLPVSASWSFTTASTSPCPCSIWSTTTTPAIPADADASPVELGLKFVSDVDGFIVGLRFYKGPGNAGPHVGNLWSITATLLATVTFAAETAAGWQEAPLPSPLPVTANTTYVVSYHTNVGRYAVDPGYFAATGIDRPPLRAPASTASGGNGMYKYGPSGFPSQSFNGNNYWVDVVFNPTAGDSVAPTVTSMSPVGGATEVGITTNILVTFSELLDPETINAGTIELRDSANALIPFGVTYDASTRSVTIDPVGALALATTYAVTVKGGGTDPRVKDTSGNALGTSVTWSFATIADVTAHFVESTVLSGLTQPTTVRFSPDGRVFVAEKSGLVKVFDGFADTTPTIFADLRTNVHNFWDRGLLGLALHPSFPTVPYVYVLYTSDAPIGGQAPRWGTVGSSSDGCPNPPGATSDGCVVGGRLSRLVANGSVMTGPEEVLIEDWGQQYPSHSIGALAFGSDGALYISAGDGASFSFVDYGQGGNAANPLGDPPAPVGVPLTPPSAEGGALRSQSVRRAPGEAVLLNGAILRVDPNTGAALPDNPLFGHPSANARRIVGYGLRNPFRFALRPGTTEVWVADVGWGAWEEINRLSNPTGPAVANFGWPCYEGPNRQISYEEAHLSLCAQLYALPSAATPPAFTYNHGAQVVAGEACPSGSSSVTGLAFYSGGSYPVVYSGALFFADYARQCIWVMFPDPSGLPDSATRSTFLAPAASPVDLQTGPGGDLFYVDLNGGTIRRISYASGNQAPSAVIQASPLAGELPLTVFFDASSSSDPDAAASLTYSWDLNGDGVFGDSAALEPTFTFATPGTYTAQLRVTDDAGASSLASVLIVAGNTPPTAAIEAPTASATWHVGDPIAFSGRATDAQQGSLPADALSWSIILHHCPSNCHTHPLQTFTGIASGSFPAPDHEYPSHLEVQLTAADSGGLQHTTSQLLYPATTNHTIHSAPSGLQLVLGNAATVTPFSRTLILGSTNSISAPSPQTLDGSTYQFASWSDGGAQSHTVTATAASTTYLATYAPVGSSTITFEDSTSADFGKGSVNEVYVAETANGELMLAPAVGTEFSNATLPSGWLVVPWQSGGAAHVTTGSLFVTGARASTDSLFTSGRTLAFVATFSDAPWQHMGLGITFDETPYAIFSTAAGGSLYARTHNGTDATDTPIPGSWLDVPHRYRIDWSPAGVVFAIDDVVVASHPIVITGAMRPAVSDYQVPDASVSLDWLRLTPYSTSGSFLSQVFDAGRIVTWNTVTWTIATPPGSSALFSVRTGETPIPDATWTAFQTVAAPATPITATARYIQYRVTLTTTDPNHTPVLHDVTISGKL